MDTHDSVKNTMGASGSDDNETVDEEEDNAIHIETIYIKQEPKEENDSINDYHSALIPENHPVQVDIKKECDLSTTSSNNIDPQQTIKQEIDSQGDDHNHTIDNEPCPSMPSTEHSHNISYNYHDKPREKLQCEYCDYSAVNKFSLKWHLQLHLKRQEHQCNHCDKCFDRKTSLVSHQKIHIGERPFQCSHCNKCFASKSNMEKHQRLHNILEPYQCDYCDKNFTNKTSLTRHQIVHTQETAYECSHCHECFKFERALLKHQRLVHTIKKQFQCNICEKDFAHEVNLMEHHRRSHTLSFSGETISMQPL